MYRILEHSGAIMFILYILLNKLLEKQTLIPQRQNIHRERDDTM